VWSGHTFHFVYMSLITCGILNDWEHDNVTIWKAKFPTLEPAPLGPEHLDMVEIHSDGSADSTNDNLKEVSQQFGAESKEDKDNAPNINTAVIQRMKLSDAHMYCFPCCLTLSLRVRLGVKVGYVLVFTLALVAFIFVMLSARYHYTMDVFVAMVGTYNDLAML